MTKKFTNAGQFKKGLTPWNKALATGIKTRGSLGMKMSEEAKVKIAESLKLQWINRTRRLPKRLTNKGNHHTDEAKRKISEFHKLMVGDKNPRWISDRTLLVRSDKKHLDGQYRDWMFSVKNRDNWKCRIANGDCKGRLEAHHILNWIDYFELRYAVNNGITLCHAHHPKGRKNEAKLSPFFQKLVAEVN